MMKKPAVSDMTDVAFFLIQERDYYKAIADHYEVVLQEMADGMTNWCTELASKALEDVEETVKP